MITKNACLLIKCAKSIPTNGVDPSNPNNFLQAQKQPHDSLVDRRMAATGSTEKVGAPYAPPTDATGYADAVARGARAEIDRQGPMYAWENGAPQGSSQVFGRRKNKCNVFVNKSFEYGGNMNGAHALTNDTRGDIQSARNLYQLASKGGAVNDRLYAHPVDPQIAPFAEGALVTQRWNEKGNPHMHHHVGVRTAPYSAASATSPSAIENMFADRQPEPGIESDIRTAYVLPKGMDVKPLMERATKRYIESRLPSRSNMYGLFSEIPEVPKHVYDAEWRRAVANQKAVLNGTANWYVQDPDVTFDDLRRARRDNAVSTPLVRYKGQPIASVLLNNSPWFVGNK